MSDYRWKVSLSHRRSKTSHASASVSEHLYLWALAVDPHDPDSWYVAATHHAFDAHSGYFHGDHHANAYVYRWKGKGPWEPLTSLSESKKIMPYSLAISNEQLFAGFADGSLYVSADVGDNWQPLEITGERITRIAAMVAIN